MLIFPVQEQWQRKKQTKEQAKAAKLAKLNPDNARSARDLLDEREERSNVTVAAGKRKRDGDESLNPDEEEGGDLGAVLKEKPMEGLKRKKAKIEMNADPLIDKPAKSGEGEKLEVKQEKAKEKARVKQLRKEKKKEKLKNKSLAKDVQKQQSIGTDDVNPTKVDEGQPSRADESGSEHEVLDFDGQDLADISSASPSSKPPSPAFDLSHSVSGTSSISSIATPKTTSDEADQKGATKSASSATQEELRERLQARIAELRQARKADGEDDKPARTRTELIEQRRKKVEQRKAMKKALRTQAKEEERRQRNEALARGSRLMTSSGAMSPAQLASPRGETNNFSFSRMQFDNGQFMSADLSSVLDPNKKPTSTTVSKITLSSLEKRQDRLSNMSGEQRASAEEKDAWINARKRAQGQRIKDDTSLLKKALKQRDNKKKKSSKEWDTRLAGVASAQAAKQKRREENLAKRREEKGNKGKKGSGKNKKKTKARPGFEGSFRAGGSRKK